MTSTKSAPRYIFELLVGESYHGADPAVVIRRYSTLELAKNGLQNYIKKVYDVPVVVSEHNSEGYDLSDEHRASGWDDDRVLVACDGLKAFFGNDVVEIKEHPLDEDVPLITPEENTPAERLKEALEREGLGADITIETEGEAPGLVTTDVRVAFEDGEEIVVSLDDRDWQYSVTHVSWALTMGRETPPDPSETDLAMVDDLDLVVAVVKAAIVKRRCELAALAKAQEPEHRGISDKTQDLLEHRLAEAVKPASRTARYGTIQIAGAGESVTLPTSGPLVEVDEPHACEECDQVKPDVALVNDPYQEDVNNRVVKRWLCSACVYEIAQDI